MDSLGHNLPVVFLALAWVCIAANHVSWFRIIRAVNGLNVLPEMNPFFGMGWSLRRQFLREHKRAFPRSDLRFVARTTPWIGFTSFLFFVFAMLSKSPVPER